MQCNLKTKPLKMRRFALRRIHSHSDATGLFRNAFCEIVALTSSINRVRHIVSSPDDAVARVIVFCRCSGQRPFSTN